MPVDIRQATTTTTTTTTLGNHTTTTQQHQNTYLGYTFRKIRKEAIGPTRIIDASASARSLVPPMSSIYVTY